MNGWPHARSEREGTCHAAWYLRAVSVSDTSDGELVRRISTRDPGAHEAEAELCRRFAPRARLYGLRHLRDDDRARDLAQTVLLALLEAAREGRIVEHEKVDRFVLGACRNVAHRSRERDARAAQMPGDEEAISAALAPDAHRTELGALVRCLAALEERARKVVLLSFHEGRDAEEIATMLAISSGNVRVVRHRAVAALRTCLDGREVAVA